MGNKKITLQEISNELIRYVRNDLADSLLNIEEHTPFNQIGLDSSSVIELVLFIERKFNVVIPEEDLIPENLRSIEALTQCTYKYI